MIKYFKYLLFSLILIILPLLITDSPLNTVKVNPLLLAPPGNIMQRMLL